MIAVGVFEYKVHPLTDFSASDIDFKSISEIAVSTFPDLFPIPVRKRIKRFPSAHGTGTMDFVFRKPSIVALRPRQQVLLAAVKQQDSHLAADDSLPVVTVVATVSFQADHSPTFRASCKECRRWELLTGCLSLSDKISNSAFQRFLHDSICRFRLVSSANRR